MKVSRNEDSFQVGVDIRRMTTMPCGGPPVSPRENSYNVSRVTGPIVQRIMQSRRNSEVDGGQEDPEEGDAFSGKWRAVS